MAVKAGCGGSFDGLCCRMVIETERVFDGCIFTDENITLALSASEAIPQGAEFVSARITNSVFENVTVCDMCGANRLSGDIVTEFEVTYVSDNVCHIVTATHRQSREVNLRLPEQGIVPYKIKVQSVFRLSSGTVIGDRTVSVTGCLIQIIKVTAPVDILVPTYGYCKYPPCEFCPCGCNGENERLRLFPWVEEE